VSLVEGFQGLNVDLRRFRCCLLQDVCQNFHQDRFTVVRWDFEWYYWFI